MQPDGLRVLEGLAASGLRSFRYALEVEGLARVDANDMDADAVANIRLNYPWNPAAAAKVVATQNDARILMMQNEQVSKEGSMLEHSDTFQEMLKSSHQMAQATDSMPLASTLSPQILGDSCWAVRTCCHSLNGLRAYMLSYM